ncbi:MAG TPA: methyltransferase domain-containing protein [Vicinamibacterales bacterium]
MLEWDAATYHRISDPQWNWGLRVLDRLLPAPGERILDIGCGTARLTAAIRSRVPSVHVSGLDRSWTMIREAARVQDRRIGFVHADATRLPFFTRFDAVFSTATFHWIPDHERLFGEIHRVLVPGGRLVAQAGGGPNLARLYERSAALAEGEFPEFFAGWTNPWYFAGVEETHARLKEAGFNKADVWLESTPTVMPDAATFTEFIAAVCLRHQLDRMPAATRRAYLDRIVEQAAADDPPYVLDYWRLNIDARK